MSLAWGGFANGSPALEAHLVQAEGGIPGDLLEVHTAWAWAEWRRRVHADTGVWLYLDHSDAIPPAFRNVAGQDAAWDRYQSQGAPIASHPPDATHEGSNHGWGRALDCTGFEGRSDVWNSMVKHAPELGLSNATGAASGERWHWESLNPPTTAAAAGATPLTNGEDELSAAEVADIKAHITSETNRLAEYVRRESRLRLYKNSATNQFMAASILTGRYEILSGQSEVDSLVANGYLEIANGDAASPQIVDPTRWANIIAKCPVNIKALAH